MLWHQAIEKIKPYIVRVDTPNGHGTGFLVHRNAGDGAVHLATAHHVIQRSVEWREPVRLRHFASGKEVFLEPSACYINTHPERDLAYIQFAADNLPLPSDTIPYMETGKRLKEGVQVGWCGYPAVASNSLCFFTGHISSWLEPDESYLVDGVAIHGVSGGPAFEIQEKGMRIIGLVTEYRPNFATGQPLPGVSLIRAITPFAEHFAQMELEMKKISAQHIPEREQEDKGLQNTGLRSRK